MEKLKIQYASDLHLEFPRNNDWVKKHPLEPKGDILVLAGDIEYLNDANAVRHRFWDRVSKDFREVLVVPGNHEFYNRYDLSLMEDGWSMEIRENVHYLFNAVRNIDGVDFIMSTYWSELDALNGWWVSRGLSDFRQTRFGNRMINQDDYEVMHVRCRDFIRKAMDESKANRRVVVTHHAPTFAVRNDAFDKTDALNFAFMSNEDDFVESIHPDLWIFGHTHFNKDCIIGGVPVVCNQLGYVGMEMVDGFEPDKVIEI